MPHGLPLVHPKLGSTLESTTAGWVAVKPSDEPLRKGETPRPTLLISLALPKNYCQRHSQVSLTVIFYPLPTTAFNVQQRRPPVGSAIDIVARILIRSTKTVRQYG